MRESRIDRLGSALVATELIPGGVQFRLSSRGGLGAWAWPSGKVEVTARLVDRLDDAELSAVLAHEVAHLIDASATLRGGAALAREAKNDSIEQRADRLGCQLLTDAGLPPEAMLTMLGKVALGLGDSQAFAKRIEAASAVCRSAPPGTAANPS